MSATIGQKVRFFRKHRGISQFELETEIGASNGSISRIESDQTNPTKETLDSIANKLNLNLFERNYLYGFTSEPASDEEIEKARAEVNDLMRTPGVLAYLIDDRSRMIDISDSFLLLFNIPITEQQNIVKLSLVKFILGPKYRVINYFDESSKEFIMFNFFQSFYSKEYFFLNDDTIEDAINTIESDSWARNIWKRAISSSLLGVQSTPKREVPFYFLGKRVPLVFSNLPLVKYNRFQLVEYIVTDEVKKILQISTY